MTSSALASSVQTILENSHHRLKGHVRVKANKSATRLVYHITEGQGLAVNIEVGRKFLQEPEKLRERLDRIQTHSVQLLCGERLSVGVRLEE